MPQTHFLCPQCQAEPILTLEGDLSYLTKNFHCPNCCGSFSIPQLIASLAVDRGLVDARPLAPFYVNSSAYVDGLNVSVVISLVEATLHIAVVTNRKNLDSITGLLKDLDVKLGEIPHKINIIHTGNMLTSSTCPLCGQKNWHHFTKDQFACSADKHFITGAFALTAAVVWERSRASLNFGTVNIMDTSENVIAKVKWQQHEDKRKLLVSPLRGHENDPAFTTLFSLLHAELQPFCSAVLGKPV